MVPCSGSSETKRGPETGEHLIVASCPLALIRCFGVCMTLESTELKSQETEFAGALIGWLVFKV